MLDIIREIVFNFLKAWMNTTTDLWLYSKGSTIKNFSSITDNIIVILSICFFYMMCYLTHKWIEDWIKIWQIRRSTSKLIDYDDNTTRH